MSRHDDRPREACGVVGVLTAGQSAAQLTRRGLVELQHRGEESAGIVAVDTANGNRAVLRGLGLVAEALPVPVVDAMPGGVGVGHVRYSTYGTAAPSAPSRSSGRRPACGWRSPTTATS